jgi:hypothetical protein
VFHQEGIHPWSLAHLAMLIAVLFNAPRSICRPCGLGSSGQPLEVSNVSAVLLRRDGSKKKGRGVEVTLCAQCEHRARAWKHFTVSPRQLWPRGRRCLLFTAEETEA